MPTYTTTVNAIAKRDRQRRGPQVHKLAKGPQCIAAGLHYGAAVTRQTRYREFAFQPLETLARDLHESGRAAVEKGYTLHQLRNDEKETFVEWGDLEELAKEGRRIQAKFLLAAYVVKPAG